MQKEIEKQFKEGRLKLSLWDKIQHYAFVLIILFIPIVDLYVKYIKHEYSDISLIIDYIFIALAVYFTFYKYRSLAFKKYKINHSSSNFQSATEATAIELGWEVEKLNSHILIAESGCPTQWDGILITVLRDDHKIYFVSIIKPSLRSNPFSFGRNKKNFWTFSSNLIDSTNGVDVVQRAKAKADEEKMKSENEPEWNLKNTIRRIVIYLIILILFGVSIMILREGFHPYSILLLLICLGYVLMDVTILIQKHSRRKA
jgi:hypothetical protein